MNVQSGVRVKPIGGGFSQYILNNPAIVIAWIISILSAVGLLVVWLVTGSISNDFGVYWRAANGPISDVYSTAYEYPFPYAPTMLLWISPLALTPLWPAYFAFVILSAVILFKVCRRYLSRVQSWLVLLSPPLTNGLLTGQVSALLAGALLWAIGHQNRLTAGVTVGLIATVKPQLVALAPLLFALRRDWLGFCGAAASFLTVLMISFAIQGFDLWFEWVGSMDHFRSVLIERFLMAVVITPVGFAEWHQLWTTPFWLVGAVIGVLLVVICRDRNPVAATAAVATGSLLASPYAMTYDLAAVVPFLVFTIYRGGIPAAIALSATFNPMPLMVTCWMLIRNNPVHRYVRGFATGLDDKRWLDSRRVL